MEDELPETTPASPPNPPQDQSGKTTPVPKYIVALLHALGVLLGYGRHLLATVRHRAAASAFSTIAACFGTANLSTVFAHLNRGILRATALESFLLARAAAGRDISMVTRPRPRRRPIRTANRHAKSQVTQVATPRLGRSRTLHAHTGGRRSSGSPPRDRPNHRRDLPRSRCRPTPRKSELFL